MQMLNTKVQKYNIYFSKECFHHDLLRYLSSRLVLNSGLIYFLFKSLYNVWHTFTMTRTGARNYAKYEDSKFSKIHFPHLIIQSRKENNI